MIQLAQIWTKVIKYPNERANYCFCINFNYKIDHNFNESEDTYIIKEF